MPRTEVVERVVEISDNVTIEIANRKSKVAGHKGTLPYSIPKGGFKYGNHPAVDRDSCWPPEVGFCSTVESQPRSGCGCGAQSILPALHFWFRAFGIDTVTWVLVVVPIGLGPECIARSTCPPINTRAPESYV
jgi:hypothetical protein